MTTIQISKPRFGLYLAVALCAGMALMWGAIRAALVSGSTSLDVTMTANEALAAQKAAVPENEAPMFVKSKAGCLYILGHRTEHPDTLMLVRLLDADKRQVCGG